MTSARPVIVDTDPGQDDAVAILLALAEREAIDLRAITVVAGNVPQARAAINARAICELAGRTDVPVHAGAEGPLAGALVTAEEINGETGLGGYDLPAPALALAPGDAREALCNALEAAPDGGLTLCALGPLTNLAQALAWRPGLARKVREIVVMGGSMSQGNTTPAAEFNVYVDPEAAEIVFDSGVPIVMIPLDLTHRVLATRPRIGAIAALGTRTAAAVAGWLEHGFSRDLRRLRGEGPPLHDPCVIAWVLWRELFAGRACHVAVETKGEHTRGATVVDWWGQGGRPRNALVLNEVDDGAVFERLTAALARLP